MDSDDIIENEDDLSGQDLSADVEDGLETELEDPLAESPAQSPVKSPWKAFILTGLIASLFGAVGGGYGVYSGLKAKSPSLAEAPNVDLSPLETKITDLTTRLKAAEASVKKAVNRPIPKPATKSDPVDLSGLEKRLDALESAPSPDIDPTALSALQSAQKDGFEWPDTSGLEDRLAKLETKLDKNLEPSVPTDLLDRLDRMESEFEAMQSGSGPSAADDVRVERFDAFEARLDALENRPAPGARIERVSILAFPKEALVSAVEENLDGGLFKKALSKHVRVKDENDPIALIEGIEADIAKGRLEAAAAKFDRLPEPIQAAGQAWYDSVKASL